MRSKHARWTPLNFLDKLDKRTPHAVNVINLHTNGGGSHLVGWFDQEYKQTHQRIGCHFQFYKDGSVDQLVDTDSIIWAEYDLSLRAVSFETEDDGHPNDPWTKPQCASIIQVARELMDVHPIPHRLMRMPADEGFSYHQLFPIYNQLAHNCPGGVRVAQIRNIILPAIIGTRPPAPKPQSHYPAPKGALPLPWMKYDVDTMTWQRRMVGRGWHDIGTPDGIFGRNAEAVCQKFQVQISRQGFTPRLHGRVDAVVWRAAWLAPVT